MSDLQRQDDELESWLRDHRRELVRIAYSILRDPEGAEDVVQETLLAVLQQKQQIRRLGAYLARAVYWNALKRRARRRTHVPLELIPETKLPLARRDAEDYLDPFELERAIADLPPAQQTVIRLRFYLGLSFAELSDLRERIGRSGARLRLGGGTPTVRKILRILGLEGETAVPRAVPGLHSPGGVRLTEGQPGYHPLLP